MAQRADEPFDVRRLIDHDEVDTLFATANPNPERIGCLSKTMLTALARRERDLVDPGYKHLAECSPCYREFRALQQRRANGRSPVWWLSVAAAIVLTVTGLWLYRTQRSASPAVAPVAVGQRVELDLRTYSVSRSEQATTTPPPLALSRADLDLTLLLPTGAEPGAYDVQVVDASSRVLASTSGRADIRDFVTTLQVKLDLRSVSEGECRLGVRRQGDDWHTYPAVLR